MSTFGCEGRCGMRLDENGDEVGPGFRRGAGPRHTPQRCVLERALRAAVEEAFPHWEVVIDPGPRAGSMIITRLRLEAGGRVYGSAYAVLDGPIPDVTAEERAGWAVLGLHAQVLRWLSDDQALRA